MTLTQDHAEPVCYKAYTELWRVSHSHNEKLKVIDNVYGCFTLNSSMAATSGVFTLKATSWLLPYKRGLMNALCIKMRAVKIAGKLFAVYGSIPEIHRCRHEYERIDKGVNWYSELATMI